MGDREDTIEMAQGELDDLVVVGYGLTQWEVNFIESLVVQIEDGRVLTAKQIGKVHELWDKHCSR